MTLAAFRNLLEEDRDILWHTRSVQIAERETATNYYVLYQLFGFYIEMRFPKVSDELPVMHTFSKDRRLIPYLFKININEVFSITG